MRVAIAAAGCLLLTACAPAAMGIAGAGIGTGGVLLATAGVSASTISDVALGACAGQAAANIAESVAVSKGNAKVASIASAASTLLGGACAW